MGPADDERDSRALFSGSSEIQSDWGIPGFPGCLVPGSPFAFLVLSPPLTIFFLMCLLGWLEIEEVDWRMIELGQFSSFCWEVSTFIDTAQFFLLHSFYAS